MPSVSVIMNCLNCAKDLQEALDSVMAQTLQDFEVIFWDNGSSDASPRIAQGYGEKVRYFKAERTTDLGEARNLAIAESRGRYIAFLDCDDIWLPTKLAKQVAMLDANPRLGLVCSDTDIFDGVRSCGTMFGTPRPPRGRVFRELMLQQWISMSSAVIRRQALDSLGQWFDTSLNVCEEADVFYRIAHDWEVDYVDELLTRWRVHGNNTTFRKFGQFGEETLRILQKHRSLYPGYDVEYSDVVAALSQRAAFQKAVALWQQGRGGEARVLIAPYKRASRKMLLFWWASWLPGSCFALASRLYFYLPQSLRR